MANKKISELTAASTPLSGTEVLPIVQGGSTVKATVQDVADLAGGGGYLKYTALLSQSGADAPVATVLENTLGVTITYSRPAEGRYLLTASSNIFLQDKTWAVINTPSYDGNGPFALQIGRISDSQCHIYSYLLYAGLADLGTGVDRTSIEIRVYP